MDKPSHMFRMANPASYRILVQGDLDPKWSGRLCGLTIATTFQDKGAAVTQLSGRLADQAALFGVLNTLYQLRLPLISIIPLVDDDAKR